MTQAKVVNKPWGKEIWLELNDHYCYKRIYINKGYKTSYQYHEEKIETNYIIDGTAEVWLENDEGVVEKTIMTAGDFFNVKPPRKHRVIALTDIILQEVSTPQVDDVIRLEDDTDRSNGKIEGEHKRPALCILAAGSGTRLKHLSTNINKALLPINNRAIISNIIDKTPGEFEIVVALGYKGNLVKEYCLASYPERNFIFVEVDNLQGPGSGPGYSLHACKTYLDRPFILSTADCFINSEEELVIDGNWVGVHPTSIPELYSTVDFDKDSCVKKFKNKSGDGYSHAFIGICSILNYKTFWNQLESVLDESGELVNVFFTPDDLNLKVKHFDWYDVGTIDGYIKAKNEFNEKDEKYGIEKTNGECVYKINNQFVKFSPNQEFIKGRINRSIFLEGNIPPISFRGENFYSYEWIPGKTLYDHDNIPIWEDFLKWCENNLWKDEVVSPSSIDSICYKFYHDKTLKRFEMFCQQRSENYADIQVINDKHCNTIGEYLANMDWKYLSNGIGTAMFHGDLQFDNVVYNTEEGEFKLIDWRHSFGAHETIGDVYYDLAKLYGGIKMSYKLMKDKENYTATHKGTEASFSYKLPSTLKAFEKIYSAWVTHQGYDLEKVKQITALIYLNMAPLHEKEFGDLLYFLARTQLSECYD
ncbi:MAG: hypothetical protein GOVbin630_100 [Prokaryotic dsDNA virus sp.]|nr:MAG: hypothetical protein GOVbin630_100 [Prokaryotic dsDNA virus sp.]|tara:strand:- start:761 stop:2698 length:1938 start_codon:yes stop_codon:yes gene_type:complete